MAPKKKKDSRPAIAVNRKARFNYEILDTFEAGLQLLGSEVKSLRAGKANIAESYASVEDGELWLVNADIPTFAQASWNNHAPRRHRKLLLHQKEVHKLIGGIERDGMTVVPLKLYFNDRGLAKLQIALARGKKVHDKRQTEKDRSWQRDKQRIMRDRG